MNTSNLNKCVQVIKLSSCSSSSLMKHGLLSNNNKWNQLNHRFPYSSTTPTPQEKINKAADAASKLLGGEEKKSIKNKEEWKSMQRFLIEQAKLNGMLWGGVSFVFISMYLIGKAVKGESK